MKTYVSLVRFGCGVRLEGSHLHSAPMLLSGDLDVAADGEVTAPESQEFLDAANAALKTNFRMSQFAGR